MSSFLTNAAMRGAFPVKKRGISLELLQTFCGTDETRIVLTQPFSDDTWTYATDGRVLVRVPKMEHPPSPDGSPPDFLKKTLAIIHGHFDSNDCDGNFFELPDEPAERWGDVCPTCNGTGIATSLECDTCGCRFKLKNSEHITCLDCEDGRRFYGAEIKIGTQLVNPRFVLMLHRLPSCRIACNKKEGGALTFVFGGGEGRLMPLKPSEPQQLNNPKEP